MGESVTKLEFDGHKAKCSTSFESIGGQLDKLNTAVFGDEFAPNNPGIMKMVREMHDVFCSANTGIKMVKWLFVSVAFLSGLIYGVVKLWNELKTH